MKIEKLPSGSYRIRQQYKGKRYSITVPYKPTQKEAVMLMAEKMEENAIVSPKSAPTGDFNSFCGLFIDKLERAGKSPSTIDGYMKVWRSVSEEFKNFRLSDITVADIQREIDLYSTTHAPKTTRNYNSFVRCVLKEYRPSFNYSVKLPPMQKKAVYEPTSEDIKRIIAESVGTRYEIPLRLACLGLRRGEVLAITSADLDDSDVLTINKDLVAKRGGGWVLKDHPKTEESNRRIKIPHALADQIRKQGYAFKGSPHCIGEYLHKTQDKLGIPSFNLHMLRHFCAAYLHKEGFTDAQILAYGGWSSGSSVMQRVYRYNLDPADSQQSITDSFDNLLQ